MNDDGTVVQSIEDSDNARNSPGFRQNQFIVQSRQPHDPRRRMPERHNQLIDLTSSAQRATERMRMSPSPPPSPYLQQLRQGGRDVDMNGENRPTRQRHMVDLDHQLPTPASSQRHDHGVHSDMRASDEHVQSPRMLMHEDRLPMRHGYPVQPSYKQESSRLVPTADVPGHRQVVYEPIEERHPLSRPVRYLPEQPAPAYNARNEPQYYMLEAQEKRRMQPQQYYSDAPSRQIVLDATVPMDGIQYSADPR